MANPPRGSLASRSYPSLPLTAPLNHPPGVPLPLNWTPPSLLRSTVGQHGGPVYEIHEGDYLNSSTDAICMLTSDKKVAPDLLHNLHEDVSRGLRWDLHSPTRPAVLRKTWHRRAWRDVDVFNATWSPFEPDLPNMYNQFIEGHCRETTSGLLRSDLTLMLNLPPKGQGVFGLGQGTYDYHSLRVCVQRILNRAMSLPVAGSPPNLWRIRPQSISIHLLGSSPYHGYGYDAAADNIMRVVRIWFDDTMRGALRRAAITRIHFITPSREAAGGDAQLSRMAWEKAWDKYLLLPVGNVMPNIYNEAEEIAASRQRVLRSRTVRR